MTTPLLTALGLAVSLLGSIPAVSSLRTSITPTRASTQAAQIQETQIQERQIQETQAAAENPVARGLRALDQGDLETAESSFRQARVLDPTDAIALVGLSEIEGRRGRDAEALDLARRALELAPADAAALLNLGRKLARVRAVDEAIATFRKARELGIQAPDAYLVPAFLLRDAGRGEEAIELLEEARHHHNDYADIESQLSLLLLDRGRATEALEVARRALEQHPRNAGLLLAAGLAAAQEATSSGSPEARTEAVAWLEQALAAGVKPEGPARLEVGKALLELSETARAIEQLRQAVELLPNSSEAHYRLGSALSRAGDGEGATRVMRRFEELQAQSDDRDWAAKQRGVALNDAQRLAAANELDGALEKIRQVLEAGEDDRAYGLRAKILFSLGRTEEAIADLERARVLMPTRVEYHYLEGGFLRSLGRSKEATESLNRALALDPELAEAHSLLGLLAAEQEQFDEAIVQYERALALGAEGAALRRFYAEALAAVGRTDESREQLRLADQASQP